jgi:hypothetical protein
VFYFVLKEEEGFVYFTLYFSEMIRILWVLFVLKYNNYHINNIRVFY